MELQEATSKLHQLDQANQDLVLRLIEALSQSPGKPTELDFDTTFRQWIDFLLAQRKSPLTIEYYASTVKHLIEMFPNPGAAHIDAFIALQHIKHTNKYISAVKNFFSFCDARGLYPDIASHLKNSYHFTPRAPAPTESVEKLLSLEMGGRDICVLALFVETGARVAELRTIEISNIEQNCITITGKGGKSRKLYLTDFARQAVSDCRSTLPASGKYLFPGHKGKPITSRQVQRIIKGLCIRAGVKRVTPHQFRHFFATYMLEAGANLKVVSVMLGHSKIATTADTYWHLANGDELAQALTHSPSRTLFQEGGRNAIHENRMG